MTESRYRWVIVAAGGLLGCVAIGAMFSLPVLLQPIARDTGWSVTGVSSAMTIGFLAMAFGSIAWGNLSDRFGPRAGVGHLLAEKTVSDPVDAVEEQAGAHHLQAPWPLQWHVDDRDDAAWPWAHHIDLVRHEHGFRDRMCHQQR